MPILPCNNLFAPKKSPPRKVTSKSVLKFDAAERARQFGMDYTNPSLQLDDQIQLTFEPVTAEWSNDLTGESFKKSIEPFTSTKITNKELQRAQTINNQLLEENAMLKSKTDILIDMMSEVYSELKLKKDLSK